MTKTDLPRLLLPIAHRAGAAVMAIYGKRMDVRAKQDNSPVTEADRRSEKIILAELARIAPDIPVVSEEAASNGHIPAISDRFFLVDPLDGTREFLKQNGEFTINIGLIENTVPVLGVVYAPAVSRMFWASEKAGAFECALAWDDTFGLDGAHAINVRPAPDEGLTVVSSRSHGSQSAQDMLAGHTVAKSKIAGSSVKFCLVAAGEADLYPRAGPTMEWDTAAGHAVLSAAGGSVVTENGTALAYGKSAEGFTNPPFLARGWQ